MFYCCRFNLSNSHVQTLNFDFDTIENNYDLVKLFPLVDFNSKSGYVFISIETSTIKILSSTLEMLKKKHVSGYIRATSVLNNDISICHHKDYVENNEPRIECEKYDPRFKSKVKFSLVNSIHNNAKRFYNLGDGSSLLVSISRGKTKTIVRRIGLSGRISKPMDFEYDCENFHNNNADDTFVELKPRIYCFSFQCKLDMITHCLPLSDAPNLRSFV